MVASGDVCGSRTTPYKGSLIDMKLAALCCLLHLGSSFAGDVCYDDVGCFTTKYPWSDLMRPLSNLPNPPEKIQTAFRLYTRNATEKDVHYNDTDFGDFSSERKTIILTHGFSDAGTAEWLIESKDLLLQKGDYNVILVDWAAGAAIPYLQATANSQLVGRQMALLVNALIDREGATAADFHLVGHSLGAHSCGYAGDRVVGLARITGLDPAQPYFEGTQAVVHLDPTDADYVDVIHTDGRDILFLGVGFKHANGDVDFFPNDGKNQPGCGDFEAEVAGIIWDLETLDFLALHRLLACSHDRSQQLFVESLRQQACPLVAFRCTNYDEYLSTSCQHMDNATLGLMGMDSVSYNLNGSYYLQTSANSESFCVFYFELYIELDAGQEDSRGNIVFVLNGVSNSSEELPGWSDHTELRAGARLHTTLHVSADLGQLQSVQLTYHDQHGPQQRRLAATRLTVRTVNHQLETSSQLMCFDGAPIADKQTATFTPC